MTKQKKSKLRIPKWLAITFLVLGILFLLGATTGQLDMFIIGTVLTTLAIIGFVGNKKPRTVQSEKIAPVVTPVAQHQQPIQQPKKKGWYATWWGILLIIFVCMPVGIMTFAIALSVASYDENKSNNSQTTRKTVEDAAKQQAEDEAAAREITKILVEGAVESYAPKYCETHQQKNVPLPPADGEYYGDGKNNLTTDECRAIITYLAERVGSSVQSLESISNAKISIGMNRHELLMSWGLPNDINSTHTASGERAQWVYGNPIYGANYVYLDNDVITTIQN